MNEAQANARQHHSHHHPAQRTVPPTAGTPPHQSCKKNVINCSYQAKWKESWDSYPDSYYFSGNLHADVTDAANACADMLGTPREESMLVENASVGAVIVAQRWMWKFVEQKVCSSVFFFQARQ